jgi:hypothetical protein
MSCSGSSGSASCASIGNVVTVTGQGTSIGAATDITIDTGGGVATVNVLRVKLKWVSGTGTTTLTPRLYNLAGAAANSINMQFAGSATAVASLFDVACVGVVFQTNAAGEFFLEPGPDAGADNVINYEISYEVV